mmetsp:Transcript_47988/g.123847  ORF Transcript_47988/g.123847 Transcript_47988/m.123847 type:complete len:317 (-) Transcript_47988:168-1118(-)
MLGGELARSACSRDMGQRRSWHTGAPRDSSTAPSSSSGAAGGSSGLADTAASRLRASPISFRRSMLGALRGPWLWLLERAAQAKPWSAIRTSSCQLAGGGELPGPFAATIVPATCRRAGTCRETACRSRHSCRSLRSLLTQASSKMNLSPGFACGRGTNGSAKSGAKLSDDSSSAAAPGCAARKAFKSSKSGSTCASPSAAALRLEASVQKCTRSFSSKAEFFGLRASAAGISHFQVRNKSSRLPASKSLNAHAAANSPLTGLCSKGGLPSASSGRRPRLLSSCCSALEASSKPWKAQYSWMASRTASSQSPPPKS